MRNVKFRGKSIMPVEELERLGIKHENGWVKGNLIVNGDRPLIVGDLVDWEEEYINPEYWVRVVRQTVGQFTGLKDKNGREICGGDVYQYITQGHYGGHYQEKERKDVVYFESGAFWVGEWLLFDAVQNDEESEVIGNIHDNLELLEGVE